MYNTTFRCTYHLLEEDDESDLLYKIQFLQALNVEEWDDKKIDDALTYIETCLKSNDYGVKILSKIREVMLMEEGSNNFEVAFLCSYNFFYLLHECLIDLKEKNEISEENFDNLIKKLEESN
jgi:hypothetical protein